MYVCSLIHLSPMMAGILSAVLFAASEVIGSIPSINGNGVVSLIKNVLVAGAKAVKVVPPAA